MKQKRTGYILFAVLSLAFVIGLIFLNRSINRVPLLAEDGSSFEKAVVTEILQDNITESGGRSGEQIVKVEITSGSHKGETVEATSLDGYLYGATCEVGTRVIISISEYDGNIVANVYNYDRTFVIVIFVILFLALLSIVGGKKGILSAVSLIFAAVCVLWLYLPLMYMGVEPFLAAVLCCILITLFTLILLGGFSVKTFAAIAGTVFGCIVAGVVAFAFAHFMHITGYNVEDVENLILVEQNSQLRAGGILFSGILIASLGAVMDVAMSIASSISEIHYHSPELSMKELVKSGMRVGRDMMGTDVNTLILAFVGGASTMMIIYYAYSMPVRQLMNSYFLGTEILEGLSGTFGVIMVVPFVSVITAWMYKRRGLTKNK
ncbi:MAG TPA: YibE/F family protein [Candidatus Scatomonas pullistercoris]|uniref:YibE/F family protein n=1 Tax=Candidatus Scatomonas pullistercoris TaxID=2840920 RepID=A0A9D1TAB0_9FIRM|nr:YibE/F family protein [Candidatus Scatomonas pullistercoris]